MRSIDLQSQTERQLSRAEILEAVACWQRKRAALKNPPRLPIVTFREWWEMFCLLMVCWWFTCGILHTFTSVPNFARASYCISLAVLFVVMPMRDRKK